MKTTEQHRNVVVRYVFLTIGAISFALGTAGIVLPLLPTVPFYMLTLFCLARGSERLPTMFLYYSILIDSHCQLQNSNNLFYFQKYELAHCSNMKQLQSSLEVVHSRIR